MALMLNIPRFVGGLKVIVLALLPFFIVSTAILLGFTAAFRIKFKIHGGEDGDVIIMGDCDDDTMECKCRQSFGECMYKTLEGFFSGGDVVSWMDITFGIIAVLIVSLAMSCMCSSYRRNFTDKPAILNTLQYHSYSMWSLLLSAVLGKAQQTMQQTYIGEGGLRFCPKTAVCTIFLTTADSLAANHFLLG